MIISNLAKSTNQHSSLESKLQELEAKTTSSLVHVSEHFDLISQEFKGIKEVFEKPDTYPALDKRLESLQTYVNEQFFITQMKVVKIIEDEKARTDRLLVALTVAVAFLYLFKWIGK